MVSTATACAGSPSPLASAAWAPWVKSIRPVAGECWFEGTGPGLVSRSRGSRRRRRARVFLQAVRDKSCGRRPMPKKPPPRPGVARGVRADWVSITTTQVSPTAHLRISNRIRRPRLAPGTLGRDRTVGSARSYGPWPQERKASLLPSLACLPAQRRRGAAPECKLCSTLAKFDLILLRPPSPKHKHRQHNRAGRNATLLPRPPPSNRGKR